MKDQVVNTQDKPGQIFAHGVSQCNDDIRALLPSASTCNQQPTPLVPCLLQDLGDLPTEYTQTVGPNPEEFLLYDNGPNVNDRILVFANREGLRHLAATETLYMDGNFYMAPMVFNQVYAIRVPFGDTAITTVYALLRRIVL